MVKRIAIFMMALMLLSAGGVQGTWAADTVVVIEGYLMELNPQSDSGAANLLVEDYSGALYRLSVPDPAPFAIDGIPVGWSDLQPGLEVIVAAEGSRLISLEAFSTPHPGYIAPGSLTVIGLVTAVDRDQITVMEDTGLQGHYTLAPFTTVTKNGVALPLNALYVGDRVILHFDDLDSALISRMEIEGKSILVSQLYRATLQLVNPLEGILSCSEVEAFHNGTWQPAQSARSFAYSGDLPVYLSGHRIMTANLKYYRGKTVYLLTKQVMGQEKIERLILKGHTEYTYNGRLDRVNFFSGEFELNQKNFMMGEGTVIIKDGRLQDKSVLSSGSSALVIADSWLGQSLSNIVCILDQALNNSSLGQQRLYYGRIDLITEDSLWLKNPYQLQNNLFADAGDEVQLYYGSDSRVYDTETGNWLETGELLAGSYAVDEASEYSEDHDLKDWYGYVYTDSDHIIGMAVEPDKGDLDSLRVSTGTISTVVDDPLIGWSITLGDGYDWSNHNRQWMLKSQSLRLSTADALIIKNGQPVSAHQLKPGDRLYLVRDDFYVRCAVVK
jgi:hypothetical protein